MWGKSGDCAGIDHHSRNTRAVATAMAGTRTWTGEACHAGGIGAHWKGSGNVLSSLSGTACAGVGPRHPGHFYARGRGREAPLPPRFCGAWARRMRPGWTDARTIPSPDLRRGSCL